MIVDWIIGGGIIGLVGLMFKNNIDNDQKVARVYTRLDEVKKDAENRYTPARVCEILHKQISVDLTEIKTDIKLLLKKQ